MVIRALHANCSPATPFSDGLTHEDQRSKRGWRSQHRQLVAAAALVALLVAACSGEGGELRATSSPAPVATETAQPTATATATPTRAGSPSDLDEQLATIGAAMRDLRDLDATGEPPEQLVTSAELQAVLAAELAEEDAVAMLKRDERLYRLLGVLDPGADLAAIYAGYLDDAVLGLYDPASERLLVRAGGGFGPIEEISFAHEYVHYLQDQHFDLPRLQLVAEGDREREAALAALIEGDASAAQYSYMLRELDRARLLELADQTLGLTATTDDETPWIVRSRIEFPYLAGFLFAVDVRASGGNAAVDMAFAHPPTTTEQILHVEKYYAGEDAQPIEAPDRAVLGDGWQQVESNTLGELLIRSWLEALGAGRNEAIRAAAGWGGDAYLVARSASGDEALLARIAWDEPATDAGQFVDTVASTLDASPGFARALGGGDVWLGSGGWLGFVTEADGTVAVVIAPTEHAVRAAIEALR